MPPLVTRKFLEAFQSVPAIKQQIAEEAYAYYLIEDGEIIVGYLGICPKGDSLYISKFYMLEAYRGRGYGQKALAFITSKAEAGPFSQLELLVNKENKQSIRFYEKNGFVTMEEVFNPIDELKKVSDYRMVKALK